MARDLLQGWQLLGIGSFGFSKAQLASQFERDWQEGSNGARVDFKHQLVVGAVKGSTAGV